MDELMRHERYNMLFDYYGELLTEKQQSYFKLYYYEDYSLGEIANTFKLSRNAIYDALNKTTKLLDDYEEKMQLLAKKVEITRLLDTIGNDENRILIDEIKKKI